MELEVTRMNDGLAIVYMSGDLSTMSIREFKRSVNELLEDGSQTVVVDCREIGIISSSGLAALLWARSKINVGNRRIYLTHVSAMVASVLELTKLSSLLRIEPTTRGLLKRLGTIRQTSST